MSCTSRVAMGWSPWHTLRCCQLDPLVVVLVVISWLVVKQSSHPPSFVVFFEVVFFFKAVYALLYKHVKCVWHFFFWLTRCCGCHDTIWSIDFIALKGKLNTFSRLVFQFNCLYSSTKKTLLIAELYNKWNISGFEKHWHCLPSLLQSSQRLK